MTATEAVRDLSQMILVLRGQRVILDSELASLYEVSTKQLNQQENATQIGSQLNSRFSLLIRNLLL